MSGGTKSKRIPETAVCQKNDIVSLTITDMGTEGEGIGRLEGYALFVKDAIIGDIVKACVMKTKKRFGYARLLEIIKPSPYRVEPVCHVARQCGGCQLQHCSYEKQLAWKEEKVCGCLNRIGGFSVRTSNATGVENKEGILDNHTATAQDSSAVVVMEPMLSMDKPYYYRNKAQFPVGVDRKGDVIAGFYAGRTHSIINNTDCAIQHPCNQIIVETILQFMREWNISAYDEKEHKGLVRHILIRVGVATGEVMVCLVINGSFIPKGDDLVGRLLKCHLMERQGEAKLQIASICLNMNQEKTNVILGQEVKVLYGRDFIEDKIGEITYRISPLSFYQVNPLQTRKLYETALEYADLRGGEVVWDLYCGIGTISLFLAQQASKVCGVEIVSQAVEDARRNAEINHFTNVEFFAGAAEEVVPEQYSKSSGKLKADVVVLDPPRKGCDEKLLQTVLQMEPQRIVYVSCDPATLARDLRYLCDRGYELKRVRTCDMFGMSYHVETVCLLSKLHEAKHHVNVTVDMDEMDLTSAESKATYEEIKKYVAVHNDGMKVSNLYIAQVKAKYGIIERENYNLPKSEDTKHPQCPKEKEDAIVDALRFFRMI